MNIREFLITYKDKDNTIRNKKITYKEEGQGIVNNIAARTYNQIETFLRETQQFNFPNTYTITSLFTNDVIKKYGKDDYDAQDLHHRNRLSQFANTLRNEIASYYQVLRENLP